MTLRSDSSVADFFRWYGPTGALLPAAGQHKRVSHCSSKNQGVSCEPPHFIYLQFSCGWDLVCKCFWANCSVKSEKQTIAGNFVTVWVEGVAYYGAYSGLVCMYVSSIVVLVLLTWPSTNQTPHNRSHDRVLNRLMHTLVCIIQIMHTFQRPMVVSGKWVALNCLDTSFVCITGLVHSGNVVMVSSG